MPTAPQADAAIADYVVTTLKQSQELARKAINGWFDVAGQALSFQSTNGLPAVWATPDARQLVETSFAYAEEILSTQKSLLTQLTDSAKSPKSA